MKHPGIGINLLGDLAYMRPEIGLHVMISAFLVFPCPSPSRCSGSHPQRRAGAAAGMECMPGLVLLMVIQISHTSPDWVFACDCQVQSNAVMWSAPKVSPISRGWYLALSVTGTAVL